MRERERERNNCWDILADLWGREMKGGWRKEIKSQMKINLKMMRKKERKKEEEEEEEEEFWFLTCKKKKEENWKNRK